MEDKQTTQTFQEKVKEQVEKLVEKLLENELQTENIEYLYTLVDIHKDIENEEYWKEKIKMRYRGNYGDESYNEGNSYGRRGVAGTGRGRYRDGGSYGRRGVDAKYRGEDALDEMAYHYGNYHDSNSYGAKEDSSYKMIECFKDFGYSIAEELEPKDKQMLKNAMQEVMMELDN